MDVFTISKSQWRLARNRNIDIVDTTVGGGSKLFAPTWSMVMNHKAQVLSDEDYTKEYWDLMRQSYNTRRVEWDTFLLQTQPLALACFCPAGKFCHRHILKQLLEKLCAQKGIPFLYYGELSP